MLSLSLLFAACSRRLARFNSKFQRHGFSKIDRCNDFVNDFERRHCISPPHYQTGHPPKVFYSVSVTDGENKNGFI